MMVMNGMEWAPVYNRTVVLIDGGPLGGVCCIISCWVSIMSDDTASVTDSNYSSSWLVCIGFKPS
jgi:hypothetical protein